MPMNMAATPSPGPDDGTGGGGGNGSSGGEFSLGGMFSSGQQQQPSNQRAASTGGGFLSSMFNGGGGDAKGGGRATSFDLNDFPSLSGDGGSLGGLSGGNPGIISTSMSTGNPGPGSISMAPGGGSGSGGGGGGSGSSAFAAALQRAQSAPVAIGGGVGGGQSNGGLMSNSITGGAGGAGGLPSSSSRQVGGGGGSGGIVGGSSAAAADMYRLAMQGNSSNFNMAKEDFPALSSSKSMGSGSAGDVVGSNAMSSGNAFSLPPSVSAGGAFGGGGGLYSVGDIDRGSAPGSGSRGVGGGLGGFGGSSLAGGMGMGQQQQQQQQTSGNPGPSLSQQQQRTPQPSSSSAGGAASSSAPTPSGGGGSALSGEYGLLGLLGIIRMSDADRNALALGSDLTLLGLNLNSNENLYSTFVSPWSDDPCGGDASGANPAAGGGSGENPQYNLPMCYYMTPPALKTGHLTKFQLETLFYIFYAMPKDVLQAYAAQELYSREWRYHVDLKLWFKRSTTAEAGGGAPAGTAAGGASPQYIYFDINSWERRMFNGSSYQNQNITGGFASEEDVRVKLQPNS